MYTQDKTNQSNQSDFDPIISQIQSYIKNPALATPQTLNDLLSQVEDLKASYEEEESSEGEGDNTPQDGKKHGIAIMIGLGKGGQK